jgi:DNA repair exonuclease SbcCD ATPase subunit
LRLHRIRLANVRGVVERSIDLADRGVTVVEGPNEIGKTTTAEAVDVLFEAKDSSRAQQVRDLFAVGTDAGPRVEVEFSTGQCRATYVKQWGRGRTTQLTVTSPRRQRFSGDEAHARARQLLDADVDPALWRALKVVQGESLIPAPWAHVPSLGQALDRAAAAGGATAGADSGEPEDIFTRVSAEAARFFTPRTGQPTGPLAAALHTYERALADVADLRAQVRQAQSDVDDAARYAQSLATLGEREGQLSDVLKQARDDAARVAGLQEALKRAEVDREAAAADAAATEREWRQRRREVADVAERVANAKALRPRVEDCLAQEQAALVRRESGVDQLSAARAAREEARQLAAATQRQVTRVRQRRDLELATERLAAAGRQRATLRDAVAALDQCTVDDALMRRIEQTSSAWTQARLARELAAPVLTVSRLGQHDVHVDGTCLGAAHTDTGAAANPEASMPVIEERVIEVAGVVRVSVRPGTSGADLEAGVTSARSALADLLAAAGVSDVDEARAVVERRRLAEQQRDLAEAGLRHHLGSDTWESLQGRVAALSERLDGAWEGARPVMAVPSTSTEQRPTERALLDLDRAADRAARELEAAERHLSRAEHTRDAALDEHAAAHRRLTTLQEQLSAHEAEQRRLVDRLGQARLARSDETLRDCAFEAERRLDELGGRLEKARRAMEAANPPGVDRRLSQAEALHAELAQERRDLQSLADQARGRLLMTEAAGLFDRLDDAEAQYDAARRELLSVQRQARAARMLAELMSARRDQLRNRYIAPYTSAIRRLGTGVFGADFDVEVDAQLRVVSRTLAGDTLPISSLSGGAREQLALVERLACAELVGPEAGVPVVIDDALGFSDPERLQSMGALLSAAGEHSQVIVLTCQPERYRHVSDANVIRLQA